MCRAQSSVQDACVQRRRPVYATSVWKCLTNVYKRVYKCVYKCAFKRVWKCAHRTARMLCSWCTAVCIHTVHSSASPVTTGLATRKTFSKCSDLFVLFRSPGPICRAERWVKHQAAWTKQILIKLEYICIFEAFKVYSRMEKETKLFELKN